ncbi:MAG: RNA-binding S4 domain-containing protein [Odoribacter sp.]|nr:RNA-binding S4 domain-containing protein [Odoribacter sp.]
MEKVRIDKWLWAVRIFKTRTLASEECNKGHILIGDAKVKPSREIRVGEVIKVRMIPIERRFHVKQLADKRMSAKMVVDFVEDITPQEQFDLLNAAKAYGFENRERGSGRPTKRDRRMIERFKGIDEED